MEDWAEIRRLYHAEGLGSQGDRSTAGVARNTVRDAIRSSEPQRCERARRGLLVDVSEPRVRELLRAFPEMPATVIAGRWLAAPRDDPEDRVRELRPLFLPLDPCQHDEPSAGELAQ